MNSSAAPFTGTVVAIARAPDDVVDRRHAGVVLEAMKMEHEVVAETSGIVSSLEVAVGDTVDEGQLLAVLGARRGDDARPRPNRPPARRRPATTWPPCSPPRTRRSTPPGPTPSPGATSRATAPPARTSPTSSTPARSSSTAR